MNPPRGYEHSPEKPFEGHVADWFRLRYGDDSVETQKYQPEPRWFCDVVVDVSYATLYIEVESRASEVRSGIAQTLGYAADDIVTGVPMVITPAGHLDDVRVGRLRQSTTVLIREFDEERGEFVRSDGS